MTLASNIEFYRYFRITNDTFRVVFIAKCIFFEIVFNLFYVRISAISKRVYWIAVCLFNPQQTFSNPLRALFSKIEIFSATAKFSSLYAGTSRVPPRVLAVWAKTQRGQVIYGVPS